MCVATSSHPIMPLTSNYYSPENLDKLKSGKLKNLTQGLKGKGKQPLSNLHLHVTMTHVL